MEYITSFVYCDNIQVQNLNIPNGKPITQVSNPLPVLNPIALPGNFSFSILCHIAGLEADKENILNFQFLSPSKEVLFDTNDITLKTPSNSPDLKKPNAMQINLDLRNIVIKEAGIHCTIIKMNNTIIGEFKIPVIVEGD